MNGWVYDALGGSIEEKLLGPIRTELLSSLAGEIVEIGAGTGASFAHYSASAHVRAIEPSRSMLARARRRAETARAAIEPIEADDAWLDSLAEGTVDHVVVTLVLCSVRDPVRTLRRARRILKPDGTLVLIEHVRALDRFGQRVQALLTPVWSVVGGNCHLDRVLEPALRDAGFTHVALEEKRVPMPVWRIQYGTAGA
jgi:SAM-dependent methyltransferase